MQYPPTELVLDEKGRVYHIGLTPNEVAHKIILVGDQDRVDLIASYFDEVEHSSQHREFVCKTGTYQGKRISALSTGIGTDNIDIVMNELDALFNIDLENKVDNSEFLKLEIVRIGTCGILQPEIPVHGYILSTHAMGLDNIAHFYNIDFTSEEEELNESVASHIGLPDGVTTYLCSSSDSLTDRLSSDDIYKGITITSSGFYGPQGRQLRLSTKTRELNDKITSFREGEHRITNFEMESSALFALGRGLGHDCTSICLGIANRPNKEFSAGYKDDMLKLIKYVLDRL
jgi:uridine phosphorylase